MLAQILNFLVREVTQSCPTFCDPMDYSLPGSSIHGIFQARVLEWVAISFSRVSSWPRDRTHIWCIGKQIFTTEPPGKTTYIYMSILFNPQDILDIGSVQFSHSVMSDSLRPHGLQHARHPCPLPTLGVFPNSCPLSRWCHPTISSSVVPFFSRLWSFPASGSFQMSQLFASGGQNVGVSVSASVLPMNIQDWLDLLSSKRLSRVFSNTTVPKHQFFGTKLSLQSNSRIYTWLLDIGRCYYYPILQRRK